jgi:hypothetical protein
VAALMDLVSFAVSVAEMALGVIIGGLVNRHYAKQGGRQLENAARRLAEQTDQVQLLVHTLLRALQEAGAIEVVRDQHGNFTRIVVHGQGAPQAAVTVKAVGEVIPGPRPPPRPWWRRWAWWRR